MSSIAKGFLCWVVVFSMLNPFNSFVFASANTGARTIELNTQIVDNLGTINEVDRYEFTTAAPGAVTVNFKHNRIDSGGWNVNLYNENDEIITGFTSNEGDVDMTTWAVRIPAGTYYVKVNSRSPYSFSGIDYKLTVSYVDESDPSFEKQPNGNRDNAYKINVNKTYIGNIQVQNDIDYYAFTTAAHGAVTVNFKHNRVDSGGWNVNLYNENDEIITGFTSNEGDVDMTTWKVRIPAGTYHVKVNSRSPYSFSGIDYKLAVNYVDESDPKFEKQPNGNRNNAYKIAVNKTYTGNLQVQNDIDFYTFTTKKAVKIALNFKHNRVNSGGWNINLYNENDEVVTGFTSNEADADLITNKVSIPAGTYYLKINSRSPYSFSGIDYQFRVDCPELLPPIQIKIGDTAQKISPAPVLSGKVVMAHGQYLSKALGATYSFDSKKNVVTIKKSKSTLTYTIGSKTAVVNGKKITIDTAPVLIDKAPFLDVKSIATNLGYKYSYDSEARVVNIR